MTISRTASLGLVFGLVLYSIAYAAPKPSEEASDLDVLGSHPAIKMVLMNKEAIVLGQLAQKQAHSDTVKKFAQSSVAEHRALEKKLEPLIDPQHWQAIKSIGTSIHYSRGEPGTWQERADAETIRDNKWVLQGDGKRKPPTAPWRTVPQADRPSAMTIENEVDAVRYQCDAVKKHITAVVQQLESVQKDEFDQAYLEQVIQLHGWIIAELGMTHEAPSPELQQLVRQTKAAADQHLAAARKLEDQLDGETP
ncbi:DUF4142 domain-containing protein [Bremerella sp. JC817]|uniref:DUF4142 domain-containing protein n=1 Tax=Bremerella sp. JC817 TaxID=3231756 RepID=UPI003459734C